MERKAKKKNISKVLALEDLPLYQEDWLGLASLDNQQRLHKVPLETSDFMLMISITFNIARCTTDPG